MGTPRHVPKPRPFRLGRACLRGLLAVVAASTVLPQSAWADTGSPRPDRPTTPVLKCDPGRELTYGYEGIFVGEADVETIQESGYESARLAGDASVAVTAVARQEHLCTHAVKLDAVRVEQIVGEEVRASATHEDMAEQIQAPFYFTQTADGQIVEVAVGADEAPEVVNFKRGIVNALSLTLRGDDRYEVVESDISGTYVAHYTRQRGDEGLTFERSKTTSDYLVGKNGQQVETRMEVAQTTRVGFDELEGCLTEISIDESVVIAAPGPNDPPVSAHYHHETLTVRAAVNMRMTGSGRNLGHTQLKHDLETGDLVRLPVNAALAQSPEDEDLGEAIDDLLSQMQKHPENPDLVLTLARAVRSDPRGVDHLDRHLGVRSLPRRLTATLAAVLVSEGGPEAQGVLARRLVSGDAGSEVQDLAVVLSTQLPSPSADLVASVSPLAEDPSSPSWVAANLALGAYAHSLRKTAPEHSAELVGNLESRLRRAETPDEAQLFMRALGNAGAESSLPLLRHYLGSTDRVDRLAAVAGMRRIASKEVEGLFLEHYPGESSRSVRREIEDVLDMRAAQGASPRSAQARAVVVDWSWSGTFGGNVASATVSARALIEDEPYLVDMQLDTDAQVFGNGPINVAEVGMLTERVSDQDRRFRFFVSLGGVNVRNIDQTRACSIVGENTLFEASVVDLFSITTPPIPIAGPLTLSFGIEGSIEFYVNYLRAGDWCSANGDIKMGLAPGFGLNVDGYATLSLWIVRGGIGIEGNVVSIDFPITADAEMEFQNAPTVCFQIDARLKAIDMQLYAWAQFKIPFFGWRPRSRPHWRLWGFTLAEDTWTLYTECEGNPDLFCRQDVLWWDGEIIDAWWDQANCVVKSPPSGTTPFTANNAYYIQPNSDCPASAPWDGRDCKDSDNVSWPGVGVAMLPSGGVVRLVLHNFGLPQPLPPCPSGWTQASYEPDEYRTCERMPLPGYTTSDYYVTSPSSSLYSIYIRGEGFCLEGNLDSKGCWLGDAPAGTSAFYLPSNNLFYYAEP
ncbi:MAG: hypothetical protein AAGN66_24830 [Acidobacteriota bacterium]